MNGSVVTINNSLLYGGHTYVQLRELANVTNMGIDFVQTGESTMQPGGGLPEGISIDQPTFVYVKEDVQDWSGDGLVMLDEAVDITTLWSRYQTREAILTTPLTQWQAPSMCQTQAADPCCALAGQNVCERG